MIKTVFDWLVKRIGEKTVVQITLLVLVMGSVVYGVTNLISGLEFTPYMLQAVIALVISWVLGRKKISGWAAGCILMILGWVFTLITVGNLSGDLISLIRSAWRLIGENTWVFFHRSSGLSVNLSLFDTAYANVYYGISALLTDFWEWLKALVAGNPGYVFTSVSIIWHLIIWVAASWAGWFQRRWRRPMVATLPAGGVLALGLSYSWNDPLPMVPMLFSLLLLLGFTRFDQREDFWETSGLDYPGDTRLEVTLVTVSMTIMLIAVGILLPRFPTQKLVEYANQILRPHVEKAEPFIESLGLDQQGSASGTIGAALSGGLPRNHLIGAGPELSEKLVMYVRISGGLSMEDEADRFFLYWAAVTYDQYNGRGWESSEIEMRSYDSGVQVAPYEMSFQRAIEQDFRLVNKGDNFLYAAGIIITADSDFNIGWRSTPEFTATKFGTGDFFAAAIDERVYRVQSLIPEVSEFDLRQTREGGEIPSWITDRYLSLPDNVPQRVIELAIQLTAEQESVYDKAHALEQYLRTYEYTLDLPRPPVDVDVADYFLFDLKRGYCDYYATAMAVMARSIGLPSRLVVGYHRGTYDQRNDRYIVTEAQAHSWVEIYFMDIGWVIFEPTAGLIEIVRPALPYVNPPDFQEPEPVVPLASGHDKQQWLWYHYLMGTILGLILIVWLWFTMDDRRLRNMPPNRAIESLYQRLYRFGRRLSVPTLGFTPHEYAASLNRRVLSLAEDFTWGEMLINSIHEVKELTSIYALMMYSPREAGVWDQVKAVNLWGRLRRRLFLARLRFWVLGIGG